MKFLHAADIHLDSPLRGLERYEGAPVEQIRSATRQSFDAMIDLAVDEGVDFALLAGDLYDGDWRDYNTGLFFIDRMSRLADEGIPVFVVAGNHDAASQLSKALRLPNNVTVFSTRKAETKMLEHLDTAIHGQGFATRAVTEDLSLGYPQGIPGLFNVGLLHTCLDGQYGHDPYAPCSLDGLRSKGYQYWALGHVHQRRVICRDPWVIFPGNLQGRHIGEKGPKGCELVTAEDNAVISVDHRDLDVLRWEECRVDTTGSDSPDEICERVDKAFRRALDGCEERLLAVRLHLEGACNAHHSLHAHRERWENEFRAVATGVGVARIWLEKVVVATRATSDIDRVLERGDALGGLLGAIRDLEIGEGTLDSRVRNFAELRRKLPAEYFANADFADPTDPVELREALEDVKEMLLSQLLGSRSER
ncbi:MAG: DNA repair exonuclease [Pseudomonadota bacterium]